ncbi:MAG: M14 family metallopeptidase [Verrucomicrobiae bacterium]|nr:M14 family metallopeptidase [Verrucomicrobiae bacterium]
MKIKNHQSKIKNLPMTRFYKRFTYEELTDYLKEIERKHPGHVRLESIGQTEGGRQIWLCCLGNKQIPDERKTGFLITANIHSPELSGCSSALCFMEYLLTHQADHRQLLDEVVFYVVPRVNPDGAEDFINSRRDNRSKRTMLDRPNGFVTDDEDGNGLVLQMRWPDKNGKWKEHPKDPRLMIERKPEDADGKYYEVAMEGHFENWDGKTRDVSRPGCRNADFNRNWPANWHPSEWDDKSFGDYPLSFIETKSLADFIFRQRNIFASFSIHNGTFALFRVPGYKKPEDFPASDMRMIDELAKEGEKLTGFPAMSSRQYCVKSLFPHLLPGLFPDWAYEYQGLLTFEIEVGWGYMSAGVTTEGVFADRPDRMGYLKYKLVEYQNKGGHTIFHPWKAFRHPQLGEIEIGGESHFDLLQIGPNLYPQIVESVRKMVLYMADLRPRITIELKKNTVSDDLRSIVATVRNEGYLGTQITEQYRKFFPHKKPVCHAIADKGLELVEGLPIEETNHIPGRNHLEKCYLVRGRGEFRFAFESDKIGKYEARVTI